jgi:hypothetical protein
MFPYIMIATALIFFSSRFHLSIIETVGALLKVSKEFLQPAKEFKYSLRQSRALIFAFSIFITFQIATPFRYTLYPDELFWTEEGYRFSWRVMLIEKAGYAQFSVKDIHGKQLIVDNHEFLTPLQEKMMATQPDMILQYAHILHDYYSENGFQSPQVYVDSYVALNGRLGKPLVNPLIDLALERESFRHKPWILPFDNEIKGL